MFKRICTLFSAILLCGLLCGPASASVVFSGSGTWDATAPTTDVSAPGANWSFGFLLPDTVFSNPTGLLSGFTYALNGGAIGLAPASVLFYSLADGGMFDLNFQDGQTVSFYGPVVYNAPSFALGRYDVFSGIAGGLATGSGTIAVSVPEPATWATFAVGLALVGAMSRRRRARSA